MTKNIKAEKGFVKILASDLDDTAALKLITELRTQSIFKDASATDLRSFSLLFSLLRLDAGDKLIQRDEDATFFGIVLRGTFASVLEPNGIGSPTSHGTTPTATPSAAFRKGDIIGEEGWNEPGKRTCDVVAATQAVIAVLTYEDLRSQVMPLAPELAARIIPYLTKRAPTSTTTATVTTVDLASASASSASTSTPSSTSAPASSSVTLSIPAELQSPSTSSLDIPSNGISPALSKSTSAATLKFEPELLFRLRFKRHPPSRSRRIIDLKSISTSVSSPPHSPSGNDIMKENNVKNLTYMVRQVSMLKGKLAKSDELLAEKDTLLSSKDDEIRSLQDRLLHEQTKHQELLDRFVTIQAELVDERRSRIDAMTETATLRQQIHAIQNDATEHRMREAKKQQIQEEERNREFEKKSEEQNHTILSKQQSLDRLRAHITADTEKIKHLQHRYEIEHDTAEQYRIHAMKVEAEITKLRLKLGEAERRQIQLLKWKAKAHEFAETWESERKRFKRRLNRAYDMNDSLVQQLNAYKKILRVVSVAGYVKNFLARKSLRLLFTHLCELTTQSLIEQGTQAPRLANSVQLDTPTDLEVRTAKQMNTWPWNVKHANIVKLVKAVDGEVAILAESLAIVHRQKRRWQETCDSFFTRNIELTNQYVSHDGALQIATKRATTLRSQSKTLAQQYMALQEQLQRTIKEKESIAAELLNIQKQDREEKHTQKIQVNSLFDRSVDLRRRATTLEHHVQDLTTQEDHLKDTIAKLQHERAMLQRVISQDKAHLIHVTSEIQQHTIPMGTTQVVVPPRPSTSPATSTYQRYNNNTQETTEEQQPSRPQSTVQHLAISATPLPLASPAAANSYATTSSPITSLPPHQRDYAKKRHMLSSFHQSIINRAMNKFSPIRTSRTTGLYAGIGTGISTTRRPHTSEGIRSKVHTIAVPTTKQSQSPPAKSHHLSPSPPSSQSQSQSTSDPITDVYSHDTSYDETYKDVAESKEEQPSDDVYNDDEFHPTET